MPSPLTFAKESTGGFKCLARASHWRGGSSRVGPSNPDPRERVMPVTAFGLTPTSIPQVVVNYVGLRNEYPDGSGS